MQTLFTNQPLFADSEWAVMRGGEYNDTDLVECYRVSDPSQIVAYHAIYINTGEFPL